MIKMTEETFYEGGPAKSDLIINLIAGFTILGLPFTFAAVVRALWLRYKISNKRTITFTVLFGNFFQKFNHIIFSSYI